MGSLLNVRGSVPPSRELLASLRETSSFRGEQTSGPLAHLHKEWFHYCLAARNADLLLNLSITRGGTQRGQAHVGRVIALARTQKGWVGGIESFDQDEVSVRPGAPDLRLGPIQVDLTARGLLIRGTLPGISGAFSLDLIPEARHFIRRPLVHGPVCWAVLPRLRAHGSFALSGEVHELQADPAYHDHNWGGFRWGDEFLWQWGTSLAREEQGPFTIVFSRLLDRKRLVETGRSIMIWRGEELFHVFRDGNVRCVERRYLRQTHMLKVPSVMDLITPGCTADIPEALELSATSGNDWLEGTVSNVNAAQIVIPNETDLGVTMINECAARLSFQGSIRGERVSIESPGIFEHLTSECDTQMELTGAGCHT